MCFGTHLPLVFYRYFCGAFGAVLVVLGMRLVHMCCVWARCSIQCLFGIFGIFCMLLHVCFPSVVLLVLFGRRWLHATPGKIKKKIFLVFLRAFSISFCVPYLVFPCLFCIFSCVGSFCWTLGFLDIFGIFLCITPFGMLFLEFTITLGSQACPFGKCQNCGCLVSIFTTTLCDSAVILPGVMVL